MAKTILKWSMKKFVAMMIAILNNKFDCFIVIEGNRGLGKSTLAIHLLRQVSREFKKLGLQDYKFHWKHSFLYTKKETKRFWHKWRSSGIGDEMINVTFNRDFYDEEQKDIIKMINMNRDHGNLFIACVPQFQALDNQIKNLCKIRITVVRRGLVIIQTPNRTIYVKDKWDSATNEKIERGWLQKGITRPHYSKLTTFRGVMQFPKLRPSAEAKYQATKNEKRNLVAKEEMGMEVEEDVVDPIIDTLKRLKAGKIRNGVFLDGLAVAYNLDPHTFKNKLRVALNKEGISAKLTDYYWDKGKKKKEYNPATIS